MDTSRLNNLFFNKSIDTVSEPMIADDQSISLRSERWKFIKEFFKINLVVLVGIPSDIYKVYCMNTKIDKALLFDLKSSKHLNEIKFITNPSMGDHTQVTSINQAITKLHDCSYFYSHSKPNEATFKELLEYLELNKVIQS